MTFLDVIHHPHARRCTLVACVGYWIALFIGTHLPPSHVPELDVSDKVLHGGGFFVLASLFWLALWAYGVQPRRRAILVLGVMVLYSALDEITQGPVGRTPDLYDFLTDVLSALAATLLWEAAAFVWQKTRAKA